MPRDVERFWRTTQNLRRFEYGPRVTTLTQVADQGYAPLASPVFTGDPKAPTAAPGDSDTSIATTAFVTAAPNKPITLSGDVTGTGTATIPTTLATVNAIPGTYNNVTINGKGLATAGINVAYLTAAAAASTYAPLASPALTGNPTAPTPLTADNDTSIATTAFVQAQGYATAASVTAGDNLRVLKAGDTMTGQLAGVTQLGIGTATPNRLLDVRTNTDRHVGMADVAGVAALVGINDAGTGNVPLSFSYNANAYLCSTAGSVGIGTTTPSDRLEVAGNVVVGNGVGNGIIGFGNGSAASGAGAFIGRNLDVNNSTLSIGGYGGIFFHAQDQWNTPSAPKASLAQNGDWTITGQGYKPGGGPWVAPSSRAIKQDIAPYDRGLAAVLQLNPIAYRYNGYGGLASEQVYTGLIAEDVEPVMPELVGSVDLRPRSAADDEHDPLTVATIDTGPLIYALVNAVKTLAERVERLEGGAA